MAATKKYVIAVDSEAENLSFIKKSVELMNKRKYVRFINNAVRSDLVVYNNKVFTLYILLSDEYRQLFAWRRTANPGMTVMMTETDLEDLSDLTELVNTTRYSVKLRDILTTIKTDRLVLKIDIEGYECKVGTD